METYLKNHEQLVKFYNIGNDFDLADSKRAQTSEMKPRQNHGRKAKLPKVL